MLKNITATILGNNCIAKGIYRLVLHCPEADLKSFVPGQFADIGVPNRSALLLKRPLSINQVDTGAQTVTLIYQVAGSGTQALTELSEGDKIQAILPIGRGFSLKESDKEVFLVGGGVGIAPLLAAAQKWTDRRYQSFLGYRGVDFVYCLDEFENACDGAFVTSDDGTVGDEGFVTDALERRLAHWQPDIVLACGPLPMLRALKKVLEPHSIPAQVSMEQRMCCGFGACAVCVCGVHQDGQLQYQKTCVEGPVFDLYEVVL